MSRTWIHAVMDDSHHVMLQLVTRRVALGIATLFFVSIVIFAATQVLPGNAAYAVLGRTATADRLRALEIELHLDQSAPTQYWMWLSGLLQGRLGTSLVNGNPVAELVGSRLQNSAVLVAIAGVLSSLCGMALGLAAAVRRDGPLDHVLSVVCLVVTSLPEFLIGIGLVMLLATHLIHALPAVSMLPPDVPPWAEPQKLVLPVATLVIVTVPYVFWMMRAATIEVLESEYAELAMLKGLSSRRVLLRHALPNAIPPTIQAIGLNLLYLAGGVVVVEYVFTYPGIGQGLVDAVSGRDIPTIQFIVLTLAAFFVCVNILTDVVAVWVSPRHRIPE
jgi:peptide/nickel transport system permease protein